MTRYAQSLIFAIVFVGATSAAVSAAPDAGPTAAEISVDAGVAPSAADVASAEPAPSATVPLNPAEADPVGTARELYSAVQAGQWQAVIALALMVLVALVRLAAGKWIPWLRTKPGGYVLGYGSAAALVFAAGLKSGGFSPGLILTALTAAWIATGAWSGAKDFIAWARRRLA